MPSTPEVLPLTTAQLGIWLGQQLDHHSPAYNVGGYVDIPGPINADLLEHACQAVMFEAETLRIRVDGDAQVITDATCALPVQDLTPGESEAWMRTDMATPVDPRWEPVFAPALHRIGPDSWRWYVRCHHIAIDGYSFPLVCKRIAEIYTELATGAERGPSPFAPLRLLVERDRGYRDSADFLADREFWSGQLRGDAPTLSGRQSSRAATYTRHTFSLPGDLAARARAARRTWADVAIAAFASYLGVMTGSSDVRIGVPTTDRVGAALLRVPGMAANVLPLRVPLTGDVVASVADGLRSLRAHQRYRIEDLVRDHGDNGTGNVRDLFGPSVNIKFFDYGFRFGPTRGVFHNIAAGPVDDVTVSVYHGGGRSAVDLDFNTETYSSAGRRPHAPVRRVLRGVHRAAVRCGDRAGPAGHCSGTWWPAGGARRRRRAGVDRVVPAAGPGDSGRGGAAARDAELDVRGVGRRVHAGGWCVGGAKRCGAGVAPVGGVRDRAARGGSEWRGLVARRHDPARGTPAADLGGGLPCADGTPEEYGVGGPHPVPGLPGVHHLHLRFDRRPQGCAGQPWCPGEPPGQSPAGADGAGSRAPADRAHGRLLVRRRP
ncbi:hypothetical protein GCM10029964_069730 [Kibdelosporangium lantanae]